MPHHGAVPWWKRVPPPRSRLHVRHIAHWRILYAEDAGGPLYTLFSPGVDEGRRGRTVDGYADLSPNGEDLRDAIPDQAMGLRVVPLELRWDSGGGPTVPIWLYRNAIWNTFQAADPNDVQAAVDELFTSGGRAFPRDWYCFDRGRRPDVLVQEMERRKRRALTVAVRKAVWERDGGRCVQCGGQESLELDHVIPWADGGADTVGNLQLLCRTCNRGKGRTVG